MSIAKTQHTKDEIRSYLEEVTDPEIPVLNIVEMGIVRRVQIVNGVVDVRITPTYSGCPAMNVIENDIRKKLVEKGIENFKVIVDYTEAWTTDRMTKKAKTKLKDYGIAPPEKTKNKGDFLDIVKETKVVPCPYCDSTNTKLQSEFGSTACKSQYYCNGCEQPFEHFKCI